MLKSIFKIRIFEHRVNLLYYLFFHPFQHNVIILPLGCLHLVQKLCYYGLGFKQGLVEMGLFHSIAQGVDLFGTDGHGAGDVELVLIEDDFEVELAAVVDAVDDDGHEVVEFEGDSSDAVAKGDIGDAFHLPGDLFEEEVAVLPGDLREGVSVSIDLPGYDVLLVLVIEVVIIVIFRFHLFIINIYTSRHTRVY